MAINVTLYSFTKRENSTKQPTGSGTTYSCTMIDDTSLMNPVFKLSIAANPIGYNYCYVADFNRYYFIREINTYQNFWYISCECDVLASFKTEIGTGSHYVLRSASDYDGYIVDTVYPGKTNMHGIRSAAVNPLSWGNDTQHSYVLGIIGNYPTASKQVGSVVYYHLDETALEAFLDYLMHQVDDWSDIATAEYDPAVQEALLNPMQYIVSCMALPVVPPATLAINKIYFGYYEAALSTGKANVLQVNNAYKDETTDITLPKHPLAATRGAYLNGAPFMYHTVHFGPFGDIELDPALLIDATGIKLRLRYDMLQGIGRLVINPIFSTGAGNAVLYAGCTQVGSPINLSQVLRNPLDMAMVKNQGGIDAVGGILNLATSTSLSGAVNSFTGTVSSIFGTIDSATRLKYPTVSGAGSTGSFLSFIDSDYSLYLETSYFDIVDENLAEIGRPLCQTKVINTLSGYILCQLADCQITGTQAEAQKINHYMNTGFYYE